MGEIKIKVVQDIEAFQNQYLDEAVLKILDNKLCKELNDSVLEGACQDIICALHQSTKRPFKYERAKDGHFFYVDSMIFEDDPNNINYFTVFNTKYEIVSN